VDKSPNSSPFFSMLGETKISGGRFIVSKNQFKATPRRM
jgi:hypothetical protein